MSHNAEPDAESDAEPYIRRMWRWPQRQQKHSPNSRELRTWISESEWTDYIQHASIFRVPEVLKNTKKEAYVPQRVSLGPYHHGIAKFSPMDHYKGRALRGLTLKFHKDNLQSDRDDANNINMYFPNRAKEEIQNLENEIRDSYEENIHCDRETLARMLSLDGCFILQVLGTLGGDESVGADIWSFNRSEIIVFASRDIVNDILMLENQVPLIVLQRLLQLELSSTDRGNEMLLNMVIGFTCSLLKSYYTLEQWRSQELEAEHLLGFLYKAIVYPSCGPIENTDRGPVSSICVDCLGRRFMQHQDGLNRQFQRIRPAVELRNAGIRFKPCYGGIQHIDFDENSATEVLFRNLLAFELCTSRINFVSYYVNIMDNLIDSQEDVALLRRMGVLTNRLGRDNEVVDIFNGLSKATGPQNLFDLFHRLAERVNAHYEKEIRIQLQLPKLVQDYCSTPWKALASAAAIVLLLLTLVQTIFSVISVYKK